MGSNNVRDKALDFRDFVINQIRFRSKKGTSVSDDGYYNRSVKEAVMSDHAFNNFRRDRIYCQIVECVTKEEGEECLEILERIWPEWINKKQLYLENDRIGHPYTVTMKSIWGEIEADPYTIQKIMEIGEMRMYLPHLFKEGKNLNVVEIGVGFGSLYRILNKEMNIKSYTMHDLPEVLLLAKKYLSHYGNDSEKVNFKRSAAEGAKYDLVISNYAFSELSPNVKEYYMDKVLKKSKHGFLICNALGIYKFGNGYTPIDFLYEIPNVEIHPIEHTRKIDARYKKECCIITW